MTTILRCPNRTEPALSTRPVMGVRVDVTSMLHVYLLRKGFRHESRFQTQELSLRVSGGLGSAIVEVPDRRSYGENIIVTFRNLLLYLRTLSCDEY